MDISLKELSIMLVGTFVFSMLLPGLCFDKKYGGVILILHALNLLRVECILYGRNQGSLSFITFFLHVDTI